MVIQNREVIKYKLSVFLCHKFYNIILNVSANKHRRIKYMAQFKNNNFGDVLLNRHSVRHFDKSVKIPRSELRES